MKNLWILLAAVLFCACGKSENEETPKPSSPIIGTWLMTDYYHRLQLLEEYVSDEVKEKLEHETTYDVSDKSLKWTFDEEKAKTLEGIMFDQRGADYPYDFSSQWTLSDTELSLYHYLYPEDKSIWAVEEMSDTRLVIAKEEHLLVDFLTRGWPTTEITRYTFEKVK